MPRGEPGELCTRGYSVMIGYWDEPEKTAEVLDAAGWMHTGDLATMDDEGYVNIVGRIKDMVIRGGENVYPREVEEFLYTHPDIVDAQVIGVPDEKYGEELMAWVRLREGAEPLTTRPARVLRGQPRALQGAALPARRGRLPDDGDRQGAQGARCASSPSSCSACRRRPPRSTPDTLALAAGPPAARTGRRSGSPPMAVGLADNRDRPAPAGGANSPYLDTRRGRSVRPEHAGQQVDRRLVRSWGDAGVAPGERRPPARGRCGACAAGWDAAGTSSR